MHPTAALSITVILEGEPGSRCPGGDSLLDIPHLQVVILNLNYPVVLGVVAEGGEPRRHLQRRIPRILPPRTTSDRLLTPPTCMPNHTFI